MEEQKLDWSGLEGLLKSSEYIVVFSGAGISASAGVGTFTGQNAMGSLLHLREELLDEKMPTFAHFAITRLIESGIVKYVVSSNHDNMHRKSGTPDDKLSELFGNAYVEICTKCKSQYQRRVVCPATNRKCDNIECQGKLIKSGVRYGQETPRGPLQKASIHAEKADLAIVLGSSMNTSPFCDLPPLAQKMVLCNLGRTRFDKVSLTFNMDCDQFMKKVVQILDIPMGLYTYQQKFEIGYEQDSNNFIKVYLRGHYVNEPCTCVSEVFVQDGKLTRELQQLTTKNWETDYFKNSSPSVTLKIIYKDCYEIEPLIEEIHITDKNSANKVCTFQKTVNYN